MLKYSQLTPVSSLQEFCLFAVVGLVSDFFLQMFFFTTVLSIDIRRMEVRGPRTWGGCCGFSFSAAVEGFKEAQAAVFTLRTEKMEL